MPGRSYTGNGYRYGFNGKEKDDEVSGNGNQYDYGFRIYNPRLGKFLSVDPLTKSYPWYTPYQFAGNKPIWAIDLDGLEELITTIPKLDYIPKNGTNTKDDIENLLVNANRIVVNGAIDIINAPAQFINLVDQNGRTNGGVLWSLINGLDQELVALQKHPDEIPERINSTLTKPETYEGLLGLYLGYKSVELGDVTITANKRKIPNPYGKAGGPKHKAEVKSIVSDIKSRGLKAKTEFRIGTPGGKKEHRFIDVVALDENNVIVEAYQVGKNTKKGNPVSREQQAITDIENAIQNNDGFKAKDIKFKAYN